MPPPLTLHVARDGKTIGQFPIDTAQQCLDVGIILPTDYCWHEGMTEWKPVSEVVVKQSLPPLPPPVDSPPLSNHPHPNMPDTSVGKKTSLAQKIAIGVGVLCLSCCFTCSYFFDSSSTGESRSLLPSSVDPLPNDLQSAELEYQIVSVEDANYSVYIRKAFRIRIKEQFDSDQLSSVAAMVLEEAKRNDPRIDAAIFYFYLPETEVNGAHTAGLVEWGAGGKWGNESSSLPKSFTVKADRGVASSLSSDTVDRLNINVRKQIFKLLLQSERKARAEAEALFPLDFNQQGEIFEQKRVASEMQIRNFYKLSEEELSLLIQEGIKKNWL